MVNTRNGGGDNPPNIDEIVAQAVAAAIQNLRNERRDGAGSSNEGIHVWIECFNKLKPNPFLSATTPTEAGDWINHCEKLFQVIGCPDGVKARLAAFKFDGDALNWWTSYVQAKGDGFVETCTWAAFREAFYKRFIPLSEQQRYEREYGTIYQLERENAAEYMERFLRLASFVGPTMSRDAARQARHYKWGLKRWVLDRIVNTDYDDVSIVCDAARNIELLHESGNSNKRSRDGDRIQHRGPGQQDRGSEFRGRSDQTYDSRGQFDRSYDHRCQDQRGNDRQRNDRRGNNNNNGQKQWKDQSKGNQQNRASGSSSQNMSAEILPPPRLCPSCGKPHPGPCYRSTGGCFHCGSTHHKVKDRPKQKAIVPMNNPKPPPTTGRVFSTTCDQAAQNSSTITGILYFGDHTVFALFDTGATHSIISVNFAKKLNITPTPLTNLLSLSTPMKDHVLIDSEFVNCPLRFDDRIRPANLLPLDMFDFDVILGMDWLALHKATIDCHARKVIFGDLLHPEFVYHGSQPLKYAKIISAMKARTLISHGCQGFLASIKDTTLDSPSIDSLPIVRDFADVFPDELPGIPPAREVEFGIELILGAEPISKAPYRMAPNYRNSWRTVSSDRVSLLGVHLYYLLRKRMEACVCVLIIVSSTVLLFVTYIPFRVLMICLTSCRVLSVSLRLI
jgi:hypothetical protein